MEYYPTVVQVIPTEDYHVKVFFDDGKIVEYNMLPFLNEGIFKQLKDIQVFVNSCTVLNNTLAWDLSGTRDSSNCIDIDPFTLYKLPAINSKIA